MIPVVVSVPHNGTRTLVQHLELGDNSPRGRWMHFDYYLDEPLIGSGRYHLHIPLRHPMDVAESWARRGKNIEKLVSSYQAMFRHLEDQQHTLHRMEDIPCLAGTEDSDRNEVPNTWNIDKYQGRILLEVVSPHLEFFKQHYGE